MLSFRSHHPHCVSGVHTSSNTPSRCCVVVRRKGNINFAGSVAQLLHSFSIHQHPVQHSCNNHQHPDNVSKLRCSMWPAHIQISNTHRLPAQPPHCTDLPQCSEPLMFTSSCRWRTQRFGQLTRSKRRWPRQSWPPQNLPFSTAPMIPTSFCTFCTILSHMG